MIKRLRKYGSILLLILLVPAGYVAALSYSHADLQSLPPLESGDLIFQTILDRHQALPIMLATGSLYTHVGIIHKQPQGYTVIEAIGPVSETPLNKFIEEGWAEKFTVLRYPGLDEARRSHIIKETERYLGRPYNFVFSMKSRAIYCSELPYLAFQAEHLPIGKLQAIGELHMDNFAVRQLFKTRWRQHPACQAPGMVYTHCWNNVLAEPIITPASLARDPKLAALYSNYPF